MKSLVDAVDALKQSKQAKESEQRQKMEEQARRLHASANGKNQKRRYSNEEDEKTHTTHGLKCQRTGGPPIDLNNGFEAFGGSIEKSKAACFSFEQHCLHFQTRVLKDMLEYRASARAER